MLMSKNNSETLKMISVVIPVYNEVENVESLVDRVDGVFADIVQRPYEIIIVDDGSKDGTVRKLRDLTGRYPSLKAIYLVRNYGQSTAMQAGFDQAEGEYIITMDGDLQNDPRDIPAMLEKMEKENADMVSGWRKDRHDGKMRVFFSRVANRLIGKISGVRLHDYGCSLKVYKSSVIKQIRLYGELHRFIPALVSDVGGKIVEMEVTHHARTAGRSKYSLDRTFRVLLDLLLITFLRRYLHRPIHLFGGMGLLMGVVGFLLCAYLSCLKLFGGADIGGRPLLLLGITMIIGAIVLIALGITTEMIVRVLHEDKARAQYRKLP